MNALPPSTGWGYSPPIDALPRTLPANVDAEQEVLGALIAHPETLGIVAPVLSADHFVETVHASIYTAIRAAVEAGQIPSVAIIKQHVGDADLGGLTFGQYLGRLVSNTPSALGIGSTARMIRDLWALRQLAAVADDIGRDGSAGFEPTSYLTTKFAAVDNIRAALLDRERTSATTAQASAEAGQGRMPFPRRVAPWLRA